MPTGRRRLLLVSAALAAAVVVGAQDRASVQDADLQLQVANLLYEETRFDEALEAFRRASAAATEPSVAVRARIGVVRTALRMGQFGLAQREATSLRESAPGNPQALSAHADALWSAGLFDEAEREWRDALAIEPDLSRGRHGLARSLASQGRLDEALNEAQAALRLSPRDGEIHHTVGSIYERMRRYEQAAASYTNYINLLPNKERSEKAAWSRAQVRFLKSFGEREPLAIDDASRGRLHTVPFDVIDDKVIVKIRVNGQRPTDFVLDTGSEQTTISRQVAAARGVRPITYTLSAGVGEVGLRGLQLGRIDTFEIGDLKIRNVPVLIKAPALRNIPKRETESFAPASLGLSMTIDYATRELTIGEALPDETADFRLPMRHHRLSMVRGLVNESYPAYFVVDTGGEVISISRATAEALAVEPPRHIGLRVYGTSGWDRDAFLLPGVNLSFNDIAYRNYSVVVLNLQAPSVLLGFQVGGIVGHKFLSPYRVSLDLARSEVRMTRVGGALLPGE
ncbi:MAG: aspartyl protease family protein [Vicinamibacterales bacterium]